MRRVETLILLIALGFYVWFLHHFGLAQVLAHIRMVGWGLGVTIALESVARIANTLGWRATIVDCPPELGFGALFAARIAGEAVDYVTPSAQLGGQFVMALMVRRKLEMAIALATVIIAALAEMAGQIGFISGALIITLPFEARVHHLFWPALGGLALAIALAGGFLYVQMKHPFAMLWKAAAKLDLDHLAHPEIRAAADEADEVLLDFYEHRRGRLALSTLCYLAAWSMGPVEIYILLSLLGEHPTALAALLVEALGLLIERATFLIPGKLVSQEGGKALILGALGYGASVGFAVGVLRRIKEMAWVLFGLASLAAHRMITERQTADGAAPAGEIVKISGIQGG